MTWLIRIVMVVIALVVMVFVTGSVLPRDHVASVRATVPASAEEVRARIVDVAAAAAWRSDLDSVSVLETDPLRWREFGEYGAIEYVREVDEPGLIVARIVGDRTDFGGLWRYRLEPAPDGGTVVTLVEEGEVYSALFRFLSRFVFGHHGTMEAYLGNLGASFGATVETERVE